MNSSNNNENQEELSMILSRSVCIFYVLVNSTLKSLLTNDFAYTESQNNQSKFQGKIKIGA